MQLYTIFPWVLLAALAFFGFKSYTVRAKQYQILYEGFAASVKCTPIYLVPGCSFLDDEGYTRAELLQFIRSHLTLVSVASKNGYLLELSFSKNTHGWFRGSSVQCRYVFWCGQNRLTSGKITVRNAQQAQKQVNKMLVVLGKNISNV